jgi:hypothetical protein
MEKTLSAAENPSLANSLIEQAVSQQEPQEETIEVSLPRDTRVTLPGGLLADDGTVITTAEVRELTGKDEETIVRQPTAPRALQAILSLGTVSVGDQEPTPELLDRLLAGDREAILLGIFRATFENPAPLPVFCEKCSDLKEALVDIDEEIEVKKLADPIKDRYFEVKGRKNTFQMTLPDGKTQRELGEAVTEKNGPELSTLLLANTVMRIDSVPVYSPAQVQNLGLSDRRKLTKELQKRSFGPVFKNITAPCPDCGSEVVVPISLGALFRL